MQLLRIPPRRGVGVSRRAWHLLHLVIPITRLHIPDIEGGYLVRPPAPLFQGLHTRLTRAGLRRPTVCHMAIPLRWACRTIRQCLSHLDTTPRRSGHVGGAPLKHKSNSSRGLVHKGGVEPPYLVSHSHSDIDPFGTIIPLTLPYRFTNA